MIWASLKRSSGLLCIGLIGACQSAANSGFESHIQVQPKSSEIAYGETHPTPTSQAPLSIETRILNQVLAESETLGVCDGNLNQEQSKVGSKLYSTGENQYLVQLLCFQAAYQGNHAFVVADAQQGQINLTGLKLSLAGYPDYNPETQILSNTYKFRGIGDCLERSQHRWDGNDLVLLTSQLESVLPESCETFKGGESHRITESQVGLAKLGMTVADLKQEMGDRVSFTPVALGVDLGNGLEVSDYGEVQFEIGTDTELEMHDDSIITFIRVNNPTYKTAAGVGPGTPLEQAIQAYGEASLSLNLEQESQELIHFEQGFPNTVWIRSNQWALDGEAGLYADPNASYRTTSEFKPNAAIGSFTITQKRQN